MSFVVSKMSASKLHLRLRQIKNCVICGAEGAVQRNGVYSCEGCAEFYEKTIKKHKRYNCRFQENCIVQNSNVPSQKICKCCRYKKCCSEGMGIPLGTSCSSSRGSSTSSSSFAATATASTSSSSTSSSAVSISSTCSNPSTSSPDIIFDPTTSNIDQLINISSRARNDHVSKILVLENCVFVATLCPAFVLPYLRDDNTAQLLNVAAANFTALLKSSKHYPVTERFLSLYVETAAKTLREERPLITNQIRMVLEQYIYASAEIVKTQIKSEVEFAALSQMTIIKIAGEHGITTDTELTHFVNRVSESYRLFCRESGEIFTDSKFWNLITATNKIHQYRQSTRKQIQQILQKLP